jgi:hypothetical protein
MPVTFDRGWRARSVARMQMHCFSPAWTLGDHYPKG